jgi:DNA-directed RNA polymerase subunit RPC12/RpoP
MSTAEAILKQWSDDMDSKLPLFCPNCGAKLDTIRYGYDRTREVIHLTGVTNEYDCLVAECPHCKHKLASQGVRQARAHWK